MKFFRAPRRLGVHAPALADETEAYLSGRVELYRRTVGAEVPAWAHFNRVAHGDASDLVAVIAAAARQGRDPVSDQWAASMAAVAAEVLGVTGGNESAIRAVQRRVLIPLESRLFESTTELTPTRVESMARAALHHHPSAQ